jgi:hypothetical protein
MCYLYDFFIVYHAHKLLGMVGNDVCARESKLGWVIEKSRSNTMLYTFLTTGVIAMQSTLQPCNDTEYIGYF